MSHSLPSKLFTIPVFVCFSLCGFYFIVLQMALSKAPARFLEAHEASAVPLSLTHEKAPLLDKILTPLISFFVAAFGDTSSTSYPTVVHFVWSFGCAIQVPLVEAHREGVQNSRGKPFAIKLLAYPMIWGILYQRLSGGWIIPLWLLAFMHSSTRAEGKNVKKIEAESVLVGWWVGHTIPALAMLIPGQPALKHAPLWVAFPILMSLAQECYFFVRERFSARPQSTSTKNRESKPIQLLYMSGFVAAFLAHVHLVLIPGLFSAPSTTPTSNVLLNKIIGLTRILLRFFTPVTGLRIPTPEETTAASGVEHFVQFDVLVVFAAMWTALIWDLALERKKWESTLKTCKWAAMLVIMLLAGGFMLSPGAVTSLLLLYREKELRKRRAMRSKSMFLHDSGSNPDSPDDTVKSCTSFSLDLFIALLTDFICITE